MKTKDKLGVPWLVLLDSIVPDKLTFFPFWKMVSWHQTLIRKAIKARDERSARKARDESRNGKKIRKTRAYSSGKLTPAQSKQSSCRTNSIWSRRLLPVALPNKDVIVSSKPSCPAR